MIRVPHRRPESEPPGTKETRKNRAGTQRVVRITVLYLVLLVIIYVAFVAYAREAPGGTSPGSQRALLEFGGVALLLGVVGAVLTVSPAPRAAGAGSERVVVLDRWGRRREWSPLSQVRIRLVRRYPAGFLSDEPVDSVEVSLEGVRPRSYLVEAGLLPELPGPARPL